ncbi:PAS domain S-box protein [Candidatus Thorarchaeota archaeon]|nr:MAG: PAS domain S-box protein [Candidatus Thorarchaeota archaeon]
MTEHSEKGPLSISNPSQFKMLFERIGLPVVELDRHFHLIHANAAARKLLGIEERDLDSKISATDLVVDEQRSLVVRGLESLAEGADSTPITLRIKRSDGVESMAEVFSEVILEEGEIAGYRTYAFDLTRRLALEERFKEKEDIFQLIVENASFTGILVVNGDYKFEYVNDKLCDMVGLSRRDLLGLDFREVLHPDSVNLVSDRYIQRQRGEKVPREYEFQIIRADGEVRDVMISSSIIRSSDERVKTVAQILDITEEKQSKHKLEESERRHRTLIETMDSGLAVDDEEGMTVLVNEALADMLGYDSVDEMIGIPITEWVHGWTARNVTEKAQLRKAGQKENYELNLQRKDGKIVPTIVQASPIFDPDSNYIGSFAVFTDVTELKKAEAEVRFFLDLLLHDIGNQLQLILAGADMLSRDADQDQISRSKQYVLDGARRCLNLITNIRRTEQSKSEPLAAVDLTEVLKTQVRLFSGQYGLHPTVKGLPDSMHVIADSALGHLFWNLMENSIKHNPRDEKTLEITGERKGKTFVVSFTDNGPGLEEEKKRSLLDPTRRSGGVGLHLIRRMMDKYGGAIHLDDRVEGSPEEGLCIRIELLIANEKS